MTLTERTAPLAILFDADGVIQYPKRPVRWITSFDRLGGPGFRKEVFAAESGTMTGADFRPLVEEILERRGNPTTFESVIALWQQIRPRPAALELVARIRAAGTMCVLATNQQSYRGRWIQENIRYEQDFDRCFYSFEMGLAKPDEAFYLTIARELGLPPERLVMVDDLPHNVEGARRAGLQAVWHRHGAPILSLARQLRALGVPA